MKIKNPDCECGEMVKSVYSREIGKFTFLNLFYCPKCDKIFEKHLKEKEVNKLE